MRLFVDEMKKDGKRKPSMKGFTLTGRGNADDDGLWEAQKSVKCSKSSKVCVGSSHTA
jgi:hypothetical protein